MCMVGELVARPRVRVYGRGPEAGISGRRSGLQVRRQAQGSQASAVHPLTPPFRFVQAQCPLCQDWVPVELNHGLEQMANHQCRMSGGSSPAAKPATSTTTQTPGTATTDTFSLVVALGKVLVNLDIQLRHLTTTREMLLSVYNDVQDGDSGRSVDASFASIPRSPVPASDIAGDK